MTINSGKTEERVREGGESSRSKVFTDIVPLVITFALASHFYGAATAQEIKAQDQAPLKATPYQSSAPASNKPR